MNQNEYEQLDALMRVLFRDGEQAWYHVYTKANIDKPDADWLYKTLKADGYVKTIHKGADFSIPDPHFVDLTDQGRSWFSHTNYVKDYSEKPSFQNMGQMINISNSTVSSFNAQSGHGNRMKNHPEDDTSLWKNKWVIGIGTGIIVLLAGYLLNYFFNAL